MDPIELGYTYGQINTAANDRFLELEQNFGSILTHIQRSGFVKQEIEVKKSNLMLSQAELERRVKLIYQYWIYHYSMMNLTMREFEYYSKLTRIAQAQYISGEIDLLKKSLVETSFTGLQNELLENQRLYAETGSLLQQVLQVDIPLEPSDSVQFRLSPGIVENPGTKPLVIQYYDELYNLELANVKLEKSRYFPGLSAMYFDQTIDGNTGFSGFRVGLTFPLWFVPQGGRVEQARLQSEIARNEMQVQANTRDRNIDVIMGKIRSYNEQLNYYEESALISAETLIQTADLQLQRQGIEYFEYIGSVSVGLDIRREYQKLLNDYNLAVIELEYLLK
jgi:cobalt-zinc-cadmium resistance protein CzcA